MTEEVLAQAIATALQESNATFGIADVLLLVGAQVISIAVLFYIFYKYILPKSNSTGVFNIELANEAHDIVTTKDDYKQPIVLSIPKLLREFKDEMRKLREGLKDLTNHNLDVLAEIRNDIKRVTDDQ